MNAICQTKVDVKINVLIMKVDITVPARLGIDSWTTTKDVKVHLHFVLGLCDRFLFTLRLLQPFLLEVLMKPHVTPFPESLRHGFELGTWRHIVMCGSPVKS